MTTKILILDEYGFEPELEATLENVLGDTFIHYTNFIEEFEKKLTTEVWTIIFMNFQGHSFLDFSVTKIKELCKKILKHTVTNKKLFAYSPTPEMDIFLRGLGFSLLRKITDKTILRKELTNRGNSEIPVVITLGKIVEKVSEEMKITISDINKKGRSRTNVKARHICMYFCVRYTQYSLKEIGYFFEKDHTTVIHSYWSVKDEMEVNEDFKKRVFCLADKIEEGLNCVMFPERLTRNRKNKKLIQIH